MVKGSHMTDEQKAQQSVSHMGRVSPNKGVPMTDGQKAKISAANSNPSPETRLKMSTARRKRITSQETRAKMSAVMMGNKNLLGHHHSIETRVKMSASAMGHPARGSYYQRKGLLSPCWTGGKRETFRREKAKRRLLGFIPLNAPFVGCEGHHVNNALVINIPQALHKSVRHNQQTGKGMAQINALAYEWLAQQVTP